MAYIKIETYTVTITFTHTVNNERITEKISNTSYTDRVNFKTELENLRKKGYVKPFITDVRTVKWLSY